MKQCQLNPLSMCSFRIGNSCWKIRFSFDVYVLTNMSKNAKTSCASFPKIFSEKSLPPGLSLLELFLLPLFFFSFFGQSSDVTVKEIPISDLRHNFEAGKYSSIKIKGETSSCHSSRFRRERESDSPRMKRFPILG